MNPPNENTQPATKMKSWEQFMGGSWPYARIGKEVYESIQHDARAELDEKIKELEQQHEEAGKQAASMYLTLHGEHERLQQQLSTARTEALKEALAIIKTHTELQSNTDIISELDDVYEDILAAIDKENKIQS
jgi:CII-binding regulator of phage lambda lysogenization HflD